MNRVIVSVLVLITQVAAQDPIVSATDGSTPTRFVSGNWGVDFSNAYFFRGLLQENRGVIAQPHLELGYDLGGGESVHDVAFTMGTWNSLHDDDNGSGAGSQSMWYESDFYAAFSAGIGERWSAAVIYTAYHSSNGKFGTYQEVAFSLGYDDTGWLSDTFSLQPSIVLAVETRGQADGGEQLGTYGQVAIEPLFACGPCCGLDLSLALPVTVGFSLGGYYEGLNGDTALGFVDIGAVLSSPLPFMPSRLGPWDASLGVHALFLGDSNAALNGNDDLAWVFSFSLSTSF